MKYSYAVHVLREELAECERLAEETTEIHYLQCNERRIADLVKALKKLGVVLDSPIETQDDGGLGGTGGGPGEGPGPRP